MKIRKNQRERERGREGDNLGLIFKSLGVKGLFVGLGAQKSSVSCLHDRLVFFA